MKNKQKEVKKEKEVVIQEINLNPNCQFCNKKNAGVVSITDSETLKEVMICFECDDKLNWKTDYSKELTAEQEDYMIESQLERIRLERDEIK